MRYLKCSSKLWLHFFLFSVKRLLLLRWPLHVRDEETIGRAIFSSKQIAHASGTVKINAFLPKRGDDGISTDRLGCAPRRLIENRASFDGKRRKTPATFYGYAELRAEQVRAIVIDQRAQVEVIATPTLSNPVHGEVTLRDDGDDFRMAVADALIRASRFATRQPSADD